MIARVFAAAGLLLLCGTAAAAPPPQNDAGAGDFSACQDRYAETGLPEMKDDGSETGFIALCRAGYAAAYNPDTRTPDWVIERLPLDWLSGKAKRKNNFAADPDAGDGGPTPGDYASTNFDRGHQAPAGDFKSSQAMTDQSFKMTNMAPQVGIGFNRNIWKDLETDVREWILCGGRDELYVVTGPVYGDTQKWIKNHRVRVPDKFFKVIYDAKNHMALGMLLPNRKLNSKDLPNFVVAISQIEDETGITFFPAMSRRQQTVLKSNTGTLWHADASCDKKAGD